MKLLIIEDDPVISETVTICFNLRWPEAEVVVTDSGETGLKLATAEAPDVIILDVGLPGMDGYETLRQLRQITETPAIVLTAKDTEVARVKGLQNPELIHTERGVGYISQVRPRGVAGTPASALIEKAAE
jgi:two-component system OmpR family response regulator